MPGFLAKTSIAALVRCVSTEVPGTPVMTRILPLPPSFLTSHSAVTRAGLVLVDVDVVAQGSVISAS